MCCSCKDGESCKVQTLRRLKRAVEILEAMPGDNFTASDTAVAVELYKLTEALWKTLPSIEAPCSVKLYDGRDGPDEGGSWKPTVWYAHSSMAEATKAALKLDAEREKEHRAHPWWGPLQSRDRFIARVQLARLSELLTGLSAEADNAN